MRKPLIAGNWKMHGSKQSIVQLLESLKKTAPLAHQVETAVFPPYVYLELAEQNLRNSVIRYGAQNVYFHADGAYTGEVSISMLQDFGCEYVIVGHSERRNLFNESDEMVGQKFSVVLQSGLSPILCVGETEQQRMANETMKVIERQLMAAITAKDVSRQMLDKAVIAYEPVWAIGTGKTATPEQAQQVHAKIRETVRHQDEKLASTMRIIYGGSVKADNASALLSMADIDGALVGGASLDAKQFVEIINQCNNLYL